MDKDKDLQVAPGGKAPKKKPRGGNSPVIGDNGLNVKPGDNARYLAFGLAVRQLPKVDTADVEQVEARIDEYFGMCVQADMKPTVAGLAAALGVDRRTLWEWRTGNTRTFAHSDLIKKAVNFMEELWENYMQNGKINPMAGVFLGVNNYGYQDVKQVNVTPVVQDPLGPKLTEEELRQQIESIPLLEDGEDGGG